MVQAPPTGRFTVVARIEASGPSEANQIIDLLQMVAVRARSDQEPNCFAYKISRSVQDPNVLTAYEEYDNQGSDVATNAHRAGKDYQQLVKLVPTHTKSFEINYYEPL